MTFTIRENPHVHSLPLVRLLQGAIMNLRPTSLNMCTGYLPFYGSNCGLKGATTSPQLVALCNSILWDAELWSSLFDLGGTVKERMTMQGDPHNNSKELIVWILGIPFLGFVNAFISAAVWEMFVEHYQDVPSIYILAGAWVLVLFLYFKNQEGGLEKMKELCGFTGLGFLFAIGSLVVLGMLAQWILEIDITELRYTYRLEMLTWGGWIIGLHVWFREKNRLSRSLNPQNENPNGSLKQSETQVVFHKENPKNPKL